MIDGTMFESFATRGWQNIKEQEQIINDMNVFPVSDGDTGTNMRLTLENGLRFASGTAHLGQFTEQLARGMLLGARGNSGVIFSQLMKGMAEVLHDKENADAQTMTEAFLNAVRVAYGAVIHPAEGTILTVAREAAEGIEAYGFSEGSVNVLLERYYALMSESLQNTPDKLPILKEAGVVDSGAYGLTAFFKGFTDNVQQEKAHAFLPVIGNGMIETDSNCGYCTEFILRLNAYISEAVDALKRYLDSMGDSLVFIRDGLDLKVHLHTDGPLAVINEASTHGTFLSIKVDNLKEMCLAAAQNRTAPSKEISGRRDVTFIAVAQGDGFRELYKQIGCDYILEQTSSVGISAADFLRIYESVREGRIVVLPNDTNIASAARQAAQLFEGTERVCILDTASPAEGYFVMSMADISEKDIDLMINNMQSVIGCMTTVTVCEAGAERTLNGISCKRGDHIALCDKRLLFASDNRSLTSEKVLSMFTNSAESVLIFYGNDVEEQEAQALADFLLTERPDLDVGVFDGGQEGNAYYFGIVS